MPSPNRKNSLNSAEFCSILRIRPLLGKERDDQVVLEPLDSGTSVALHPPVTKDGEATFLNALVSGQDLEFKFDRVLSKDSSQEKVYSVVAQPMAIQAMESFKRFNESTPGTFSCLKNHLLICMGLPNSGSSFTFTGPLSKQKQSSDGLLPRLVESLFIQSHHIRNKTAYKKTAFGVKITALQVNQSKINAHDCHVYDLLKPRSKGPSYFVQKSFGRNIAPSFLSVFDNPNNILSMDDSDNHQKDRESTSCFSINDSHVFCASATSARECLKAAVQKGRQTSKAKFQSHLFFAVKPVLVSQQSCRVAHEGGDLCFLEMSGFDSKQRANRSRDHSFSDAHTAIMHCLKAIRHNQISGDEQRKIPYLQHHASALLKPLFSQGKRALSVTLLVTASPSIRDYADKKMLLSEILQLYNPPPAFDATTGISSGSKVSFRSFSNKSSKLPSSKGIETSLRHCPGDFLPLPPPIFPGFDERTDDLFEVTVSSTQATAPTENHEEPHSSKSETARNLTSNSPIAVQVLRDAARVSYINTAYVESSVKTGLDIMKNIPLNASNIDQRLAKNRVSELEKQTQQLLLEISELTMRNQELKNRIHGANKSSTGSATTLEESNKTNFMENGCFRSNECSTENPDNPLVHCVAKFRSEEVLVEDNSVGNSIQNPCHQNDVDKVTSECSETKTVFDDPLLQHMAMMSRYY